jgi:hypothetical protein
MFLTTAKASVHFDKLPDAAVTEIGTLYNLAGSRTEIVSKLLDRMHHSTYAELDPMFAAMTVIARKHGAEEAVTVYD